MTPDELIVGHPVLWKGRNSYKVAMALVLDNWRLHIPDTVISVTEELIRDCVAVGYRDRPSFFDNLGRHKTIEFKLITDVHSVKTGGFVAATEDQQMQL
jgi:hypothetical protein